MRSILVAFLSLLLLATACSSSDLAIDTPNGGTDGATDGGGTDSDGGGTDGGDGSGGDGSGGDSDTGDGDGTDGDTGISSIRFLSGLTPFTECSAALRHIKDEALAQVGPWGLNGGGYYDDVLVMEEPAMEAMEESAMEDSADSSASFDTSGSATGGLDTSLSGDDGGADFSGTNVQELGVDEPDIIKTDGTRILAVANQQLFYIDLTGDSARVRGSVRLDQGWAQEIFIEGDRAYVFSSGDSFAPIAFEEGGDTIANFTGAGTTSAGTEAAPAATPPPPDVVDAAEDIEAPPAPEPDVIEVDPLPTEPFPEPFPEPGRWLGPSATIQEIDLTNPDNMAVLSTLTVDGSYLSARKIGETARVVLTSPPRSLDFVFPSGQGSEARAEEFNRQVIEDSTIEDWVPTYTLTTPNGTETGSLLGCDRLHKPAEFSGFNVLSVLTLDLTSNLTPGNAVGVLADGQTVYASLDNLYVGTTVWIPQETIDAQGNRNWDEEYKTSLHQFSLASTGEATYVASGSVRGYMLNQFSLNEHNGDLQVVTTDGAPWTGNGSESFVTVLRPEGDELVQIGQVGDLGRGEQVFSVRLMGDTGYVVTFEQVDPFYVIDLSDPTNPFAAGELKIPGVSTFLQQVGPDRVLGLGQDATDEGFTTGFKAELFDVSDPQNPQSIAVWTQPNSYSVAEYEHRAFQHLEEDGLVVFPLEAWNDGFFGAIVLNVDDLTEYGRISQEPIPEDSGQGFESDCAQITQDMISEQTELWWILQDGGTVQLCNDNNVGGSESGNCEVLPISELPYFASETFDGDTPLPAAIADLGDDFDRMELCWNDGFYGSQYPIQRTFTVGETLWSFSYDTLQANNLDGLDITDRITLN